MLFTDIALDAPGIDPDFYDTVFRDSAMVPGSGAKYTKVASEPAHPGKVQNGNGAWYEIAEPVLAAPMFGAYGDGSIYGGPLHDLIVDLRDTALALCRDMYFPAGTYMLEEQSFPFRQPYLVTALEDYKNITLYGDGPLTILRTDGTGGADVLQFNGLKNFHVRDIAITSAVSGNHAGSNGISIVNGFDNITVKNIAIGPLGGVRKPNEPINGGAAVSFQMTNAAVPWGTFVVDNVRAYSCREGFGFEGDLVQQDSRAMSITVTNFVAEGCYQGYKIANGAATGALSGGMWSGISIEGKSINCQHDVVLGRVHGCKVDVEIITNKTGAQRLLDASGTQWLPEDGNLIGLTMTYAHHSSVRVLGNKADCTYKARIGGASPGSSGLPGSTSVCDIVLDIAGSSFVTDIDAVVVGSATTQGSTIAISTRTAAGFPAEFASNANNNTLTRGPSSNIRMFGNVTGLQGRGTTGAGDIVAGLYDKDGVLRLGIKNGNGLVIDYATSTAPVGSYARKLVVHDNLNNIQGWIALYN